jgi:hypothetical protein
MLGQYHPNPSQFIYQPPHHSTLYNLRYRRQCHKINGKYTQISLELVKSQILHYCYNLLRDVTAGSLWITQSNQAIVLIIASRMAGYSTDLSAVRKYELLQLYIYMLKRVRTFHDSIRYFLCVSVGDG